MPVSRFFRKLGLLLPGIALLSALAGWAGYRHSLSVDLDALQHAGQGRVALYAASLERQIDKYAFLPATLALERDVGLLLAPPPPVSGLPGRSSAPGADRPAPPVPERPEPLAADAEVAVDTYTDTDADVDVAVDADTDADVAADAAAEAEVQTDVLTDALADVQADALADALADGAAGPAAARDSGDVSLSVNRFLESLNQLAGTRVIYVLDKQGKVLASSNWQAPDSFLGEDLSYRNYFREAAAGRAGRFFGVGTTRGDPGYYLSSPLYEAGQVAGVAVVKIGLEQLEQSWRSVDVPVLVTDANGIVILTSSPAWKFAAMQDLTDGERARLRTSLQYFEQPLAPLGLEQEAVLPEGAQLVRLPPAAGAPDPGPVYLAQAQPLGETGWTLTVFSPAGQLAWMAWTRAALAAAATALLCILLLLWQQRRAYLRERLQAREALQRAHDELERKVEERTLHLRAAQDELVHAGKMAVIGQLSAELAHELSQPLAALRTLSGNAGRFMERGDLDAARGNLERIGTLVDTMGGLTSRLKLFARKSDGAPQPVDVRRTIDNALFLLEPRLRQVGAGMRMVIAGGVVALCDANRLEQVLVNLIGNALDAVEGLAAPAVRISAKRDGGRVRIEVADNGPGLPEEVLTHLFEPFFTTKEAGRGLGLGLAISAGIVRDFGGSLSAAAAASGGALFVVDLPAAPSAPSAPSAPAKENAT
ncbi:sensor histidine kinase [Kerstersia sp.]|uniref:sensor histidine kinase n=1 Tax=Kerstersia sp. TaxID=1930783 RepID=UPI003F91C1E6